MARERLPAYMIMVRRELLNRLGGPRKKDVPFSIDSDKQWKVLDCFELLDREE